MIKNQGRVSMNVNVISQIMFSVTFFASCADVSSKSNVKSAVDAKLITENPDGTFQVECYNGTSEKRTREQIFNDEVCRSVPEVKFTPEFGVIYEKRPTKENGNWCKFRLTMSAPEEQIGLVDDVVFDVHPTMGQWRYSGIIPEKSTATQLVSDDRDTNSAAWKTKGTKVTLKSGEVLNFPPIQIECQQPQLLKSGRGSEPYTKPTYGLSFEVDNNLSESLVDEVLGSAGASRCPDSSDFRFSRAMDSSEFKAKVLSLSNGRIRITGIDYRGDYAILSCGDGSTRRE